MSREFVDSSAPSSVVDEEEDADDVAVKSRGRKRGRADRNVAPAKSQRGGGSGPRRIPMLTRREAALGTIDDEDINLRRGKSSINYNNND